MMPSLQINRKSCSVHLRVDFFPSHSILLPLFLWQLQKYPQNELDYLWFLYIDRLVDWGFHLQC